jgi:outer membrane protein assembly factor BamB
MTHRPIALAVLILVIAACTSAGPPPLSAGPSSSAVPETGQPTAAPRTARPTATPHGPTGGGEGDMLVVRRGGGGSDDRYAVLDGATMQALFELPLGVADRDWRTVYVATASGDSTAVRAIDPNGGTVVRELTVPGAWRLPTIGLDRTPTGLSGDGRTVVLEEARPAGTARPAQTRFAVVSTDFRAAARILTLPGALDFDALSPDGGSMYVIEHLPGGDPLHYDVRRVDLAAGTIVDGIIVDKRNIDEQMTGYALTQVPAANGWMYTVYEGASGPFIHALDTPEAVAFCIDLPASGSPDAASSGAWGLVLSGDGRHLYAANGALDLLSVVDLGDFSVRSIPALSTAPTITLAKFGHGVATAGGRQAALSQDGTTLYVLTRGGLATVTTADLARPAATVNLGGTGLGRSIAVGSGGVVYVIDAAGRAMRIDPATGRQLAATSGPKDYRVIEAVVSAP